MRSKLLLLILIVISGLAACSGGSHRFTIIGDFNGMPEQTVVLEQMNADDMITIVDSEHTKPDGSFELSAVSPEPGLYRIHFHQNKFILLSIDKGNIKVSGNWNALDKYSVAGSVSSEQLKSFFSSIGQYLLDFKTLSSVLDTFKARGNDSMFSIAKKNFQDMNDQFTHYVEHFADTSHYEPNAVFAAKMVNAASEATFLEQFTQTLNHKFPGTKMSKDFTDYYLKITAKQRIPTNKSSLAHGSKGPELVMQDADGKTVALTTLRGKYVLLDFWASWCAPCRAENPNLVAVYQKFKDKNFTILSVSLDNNKDAWLKAVKDDNLTWTQVSDLKGWNSDAALAYSVQSIPTNFLLDSSGRIIADNLRGEELQKVLSVLLKVPNP